MHINSLYWHILNLPKHLMLSLPAIHSTCHPPSSILVITSPPSFLSHLLPLSVSCPPKSSFYLDHTWYTDYIRARGFRLVTPIPTCNAPVISYSTSGSGLLLSGLRMHDYPWSSPALLTGETDLRTTSCSLWN